ncbi:MAG: prepilin peptidase [Lachnospiraceae bacterium]|nr:prepilin peptidase [Lachnospiraceae bacterium]
MMDVLRYANWVCFTLILIIAMWQDVKMRRIKNEVNVAGVVLGILFALILPEREVLPAIAGLFALLAVGILCWRLKFFRAGDAKLLCVVGAFLEWKMGLNVLLLAIILGALFGEPLVIRRIVKKEEGLTQFPFSIAIGAACVIGIRFGYIWEWLKFM